MEEISRFTGIPLYKLQAGKQSYQSNEQQGIDYVVNTLQPIVTQWEQELTEREKAIREKERELSGISSIDHQDSEVLMAGKE